MNQERMLTIVLGPHVSEKSSIISEMNNQVTFKVARDATKPEIKKACSSQSGTWDIIISPFYSLA